VSAPPGVTPTTPIRRSTSADESTQTEHHIRLGSDLLTFWGIGMSHNRLVKHVRRFEREVTGFTFFDYLANAVQADDEDRRRAHLDPELARAISYADPTGETAVRNVMGSRS